MPPANSDDRIRDLCTQAVAAKTEAELLPILAQLQSGLQSRYVG